MRRGMATAGGNDDPSRNYATEDTEENAPNGIFYRNKRGKPATEDARTSTSQSTLNLVNCILGAGVLGYPFCFRSCGLLLGTVIMLVSYIASRFSYNLLLYCSQISNKRSYEDLAEQAIGKVGRQIVQLCTAALNLGCIVAYLNILADVLSAVAGTIIPPGAEPSRNAYITGVSIFGALPVALWVRDHATIVTFMMASVGFVFLFAIVVVIFALAPHPVAAAAANAVAMWRPEGLLVAFPVVVYSFTAHPYYLGIFNNLHGATFERMSRVTNVAMGLSGSLYWVVGVFGYLTFRNRTAGDLLRNFGAVNVDGLRGAYERAIKLCYGLSILGSVPLVILPFYSLMLPVLGFHGRGDYALGGAGSRSDRGGIPKRTSSGSLPEMEETDRHSSTFSVGSPTGTGRRVLSKLGRTGSHEVDVVDLKLHADRDSADGDELSFSKHALVVVIVLGTSLATAIWVPNIEFIFGLTGATASVLLSYILPAITFIKLMDLNPELLGGGNFKVIPPAIRSEWLWRKRKAIALLCFGVVSGITCTDAILGAVQQEAAVVHLAQQLVAHEVVVAETAKVQQKARAAVTAMSAVEMAAKELGSANVSATGTFTKLQQAAAQLDTIAGGNSSAGGDSGKQSHEWGIQTLVKEHSKHVAETKVLKAVEAALADIKDEVRRTAASVSGVITQLDAAIAQLNTDESAAAGGGNGTVKCDKPPCKSSTSHDRASDLAMELGKALGMFSEVAANATVAGKSLAQVRSTAVSTLVALNQTAAVLDHVSTAVEAAKKSNKHDDEIKKTAVAAMQLALNATATSALAMQLTGEALQRSATEEASELLDMLVKVSHDLEKSSARVPKVKRTEGGNATASTATASGTSSAAASAGAAAAQGSANSASVDAKGTAGGSTAGSSASGATKGKEAGSSTELSSTGTAGNLTLGAEKPPQTGADGSGDKAAEAAGQLEQVIKDLNNKIVAATSTTTVKTDTATTAAAAAAAAAAAVATAVAATGGSGVGAGSGAAGANTGNAGSGASTSSKGPSAAGALVDTSSGGSSSGATSTKEADSGAAAAAAVAAALLSGNVTSGTLGSSVNVSGIAAALQTAVEVTKVKQDEALQEIQNSLTNTKAEVAERVVDILKDISETQKEASTKGAKAGTSGTSGIDAVLNSAGGDSAAAAVTGGFVVGATGSDAVAAGAASDGASGGDGSGSSGGSGTSTTLEGAIIGLVHKITDKTESEEKPEDVVGPVVKVDKDGNLIQEDDGGEVTGPIVKDSDTHTDDAASNSRNSRIESSSDASQGTTGGSQAAEAATDTARRHRKIGAGSMLANAA